MSAYHDRNAEKRQKTAELKASRLRFEERQKALAHISEKFGIAVAVRHMQRIMLQVTQKEVSPQSVTAAHGCVAQINESIRTAIAAAQFLAES